jgi:uncharacterized glyoxalase superfamily protein PhnB
MTVEHTSARLRTLTPVLMVENVAEAATWYEAILGIATEVAVPGEGGLQFVILHRDDVRLMLQSRISLDEDFDIFKGVPIGASGSLFLDVTDVADWRRRVDGKVRIVKELHDSFYGTREFYFADPNGYIFGFSESIETP